MDVQGFIVLFNTECMKFLEYDLEEIIYKADVSLLQDRGLNVWGKLLRQKKIGNYGVADLIEYQRPYTDGPNNDLYKGCINVIELKKDKISVSSFLQAVNYLKGIQSYLEKRGVSHMYDYEITLIGSSIDKDSSFVFLTDIINSQCDFERLIDRSSVFRLNFLTYSYKIDGLYFDVVSNYDLKNKGF